MMLQVPLLVESANPVLHTTPTDPSTPNNTLEPPRYTAVDGNVSNNTLVAPSPSSVISSDAVLSYFRTAHTSDRYTCLLTFCVCCMDKMYDVILVLCYRTQSSYFIANRVPTFHLFVQISYNRAARQVPGMWCL